MFRLNINNDDVVEYTNKLERLHRSVIIISDSQSTYKPLNSSDLNGVSSGSVSFTFIVGS